MSDGIWDGGKFVLASTIHERQARLERRIESLEAENAALKRELERANAIHERLADRLEIRQDPDGSIHDEIDRLRLENAVLREQVERLNAAIDYVTEETGYYTLPKEFDK